MEDLLRDRDLPHVVQQRSELDVPALGALEAEPVRDGDGELHDAAGVEGGVLVVVVEHVAEEQRGATVGAAQLERLLDPDAALAAEDVQQPHQRQDQ